MLAEEFVALLSFKAPSGIKLSAFGSAVDQDYLLETLGRLERSFNKHLRNRRFYLTAQERTYYELLCLLARLIPAAMAASRAEPLDGLISRLTLGVADCLATLHATSLSIPTEQDSETVLLMLASPHGLSYLRDAAIAIKLGVATVTSHNEREKERDRSGQTTIRKEVMAHMSTLDGAAAKELQHGKARVEFLKKEVAKPEFEKQVMAWARDTGVDDQDGSFFRALGEMAEDDMKSWARVVANSWRQQAKGWNRVKWA
jgi:hypothetical protein